MVPQPEPKINKLKALKAFQRSLSVIDTKIQNLLTIFGCGPGKTLPVDSLLIPIFELVVKAQVEAGKGVLGPIDTQLLKNNCS